MGLTKCPKELYENILDNCFDLKEREKRLLETSGGKNMSYYVTKILCGND